MHLIFDYSNAIYMQKTVLKNVQYLDFDIENKYILNYENGVVRDEYKHCVVRRSNMNVAP